MSVDENDLKIELNQGDRVHWATMGGDVGKGTVLDEFDDHLVIVMRDVAPGEFSPLQIAPRHILVKLPEE